MIDRAVRNSASAQGWSAGNLGEARVALALHRLGVDAGSVEEQHRVGRYRLDFAWPQHLIAVEADGWVHETLSVRASDIARDAVLARLGWLVIRIPVEQLTDADLETLLARVVRFVVAQGARS